MKTGTIEQADGSELTYSCAPPMLHTQGVTLLGEDFETLILLHCLSIEDYRKVAGNPVDRERVLVAIRDLSLPKQSDVEAAEAGFCRAMKKYRKVLDNETP